MNYYSDITPIEHKRILHPYSIPGFKFRKNIKSIHFIERIKKIACQYYKIDQSLLISHKTNEVKFISCKYVIMVAVLMRTTFSSKYISMYMGYADHTAGIRAKKRYIYDRVFREEANEIISKL